MAKKEKKVTNSKENNSKESKNKKSFFKGLKAELKKVIWPSPKQLVNNTIAVITIVIMTAVIVFVLDLAFESINKYGIDKIKESVQTLESNTSEESNTTQEESNTSNDSSNTSVNEVDESTVDENQQNADSNVVE